MFEITGFHENVYIDGNILFDSDKEVSYTDVVAYSTIKKDDCKKEIKASKVIQDNGNETYCVTNELICEDDVIYHVTRDVISYGVEKKLSNPYNCIYTYNQNILDMNEILKSGINKSSPLGSTDISIVTVFRTLNSLSSVNRMLFQSVLSNYELFVMDILVTCYLKFDWVRKSYLVRKRFSGLSDVEVVLKLRSYQYNNIKDEVENLFKTLLNVELPDSKYLIEAYEKRNNLAHRYFTTIYGEAVVITDNELKELVCETNKFVYELFEKVIEKMY